MKKTKDTPKVVDTLSVILTPVTTKPKQEKPRDTKPT